MRCFSIIQPSAWLVVAAALGCREPRAGASADAPVAPMDASDKADSSTDTGYPPPNADLVAPVGSAGALDIAAWNIENFPCGQYPGCRDSASATVVTVADLIASLEIDVIAVEEIADVAAWNEVLARLPAYDGVLSTHAYGDGDYQKVGVIYRTDAVSLSSPRLILTDHGYEFPRPPLEIQISTKGAALDFTMIVVHLKAGLGPEDRQRREAASNLLEEYVRNGNTGDGDVVILGDFNNVIDDPEERQILSAWLSRPDDYAFATEALSADGAFTFLPDHVLLDHIVTTASLADDLAGGSAIIPRLDQTVVNYEYAISDHLPVVTGMPIF